MWDGQPSNHTFPQSVQARRFSLLGHISQTPDETDAKILTAATLENWMRPLGHPRTVWMKNIWQDLKSDNLSLNEAIKVAQNHPLRTLMVVHTRKEKELDNAVQFSTHSVYKRWIIVALAFFHCNKRYTNYKSIVMTIFTPQWAANLRRARESGHVTCLWCFVNATSYYSLYTCSQSIIPVLIYWKSRLHIIIQCKLDSTTCSQPKHISKNH